MSFITNLFGIIKRIFGGGSPPVALDVDITPESSIAIQNAENKQVETDSEQIIPSETQGVSSDTATHVDGPSSFNEDPESTEASTEILIDEVKLLRKKQSAEKRNVLNGNERPATEQKRSGSVRKRVSKRRLRKGDAENTERIRSMKPYINHRRTPQ